MSKHRVLSRLSHQLMTAAAPALLLSLGVVATAHAGFITFEAAGANPAAIQATVDSFRSSVGPRREINWDGVPASRSDPNPLPADFFNTTSARGVVFSTPGTGFLVSADAGGAQPVLFGFPSDFQTFSAQKLFTAVNSNTTDVHFFLPGTSTAATTSAFGLIFVDVETSASAHVDFFNASNQLIYSREAIVAGNQGLSFVGAIAGAGERISRVRITAGVNTIVSNGVLGNPNDDVSVMDDFIYAEPAAGAAQAPVPATLALTALGLVLIGSARRRAA